MREIKFRGVDIESGEVVFAELGNIGMTCKGDKYYFGIEYAVSPESIEQFVGYDKNDIEVYEGDRVKNPATGDTFRASLSDIGVVQTLVKTNR